MSFCEPEAGLIQMAFAFKREVSTGKGGRPLCFQAAMLLLFKQRLKKISFAFHHSKIAKPRCATAMRPNARSRKIPPNLLDFSELINSLCFLSDQRHLDPSYFSLGIANEIE